MGQWDSHVEVKGWAGLEAHSHLLWLRTGSWAADGHKGQGLWLWLGPPGAQSPHCLSSRPLWTQPAGECRAPKTEVLVLSPALRPVASLPISPGHSCLGLQPPQTKLTMVREEWKVRAVGTQKGQATLRQPPAALLRGGRGSWAEGGGLSHRLQSQVGRGALRGWKQGRESLGGTKEGGWGHSPSNAYALRWVSREPGLTLRDHAASG